MCNNILEIEQEKDGHWLTEVIELLGVMAYEKSREQAILKVQGDQLDYPYLKQAAQQRGVYDLLQEALSELYSTAPVKNGVPFEESFTMIWHFILGYANNYLVEAGLFVDPYADGRVDKGSISVIFHKDAI